MIKTRALGMKSVAVLAIGFLLTGMSATLASAATVTTDFMTANVVKTNVVKTNFVTTNLVTTNFVITNFTKTASTSCVASPGQAAKPAVPEITHTEYRYMTSKWNWVGDTRQNEEKSKNVGDPDYGKWGEAKGPTTDWQKDPYSSDPWQRENGDNWYKWVQVDSKTVIDVHGHAAVPAVPATYCEWYTWNTGSFAPNAQNGSDVNWPQTLVGEGQLSPTACETTYQQDLYGGTRDQINAVITDGLLVKLGAGQYEDSSIVKAWHFVSTEKCPPIAIKVQPTVTTTDMCGPDNATLTGNPQDGVVWSSVTKSEDGTLSITASPATGYSFPEGFQTTFTMKDSGKICIVTVEVQPTVTTTDMCGPDNATLTGNPQDGVVWSSVTKSEDGTLSITASPATGYSFPEGFQTTFTMKDSEKACPTEVKTVTASVIDPPICGPNNDVLNIPTTPGVMYSDTGWVDGTRTITATAAVGYVLQGQTSWTFHDENTPCNVTPPAPTVVPICFPNNDTVTIPEATGVLYSDTGWVDGKRTITASAASGYALSGATTWMFTDVPSGGCAAVGAVFSAGDPAALAFTGAPSNTGGLIALAIILVTSGTALVARKVRGW